MYILVMQTSCVLHRGSHGCVSGMSSCNPLTYGRWSSLVLQLLIFWIMYVEHAGAPDPFNTDVDRRRLELLNSTCTDLLQERHIFNGKQRDMLHDNLWYIDRLRVVFCSSGGYLFRRFAFFWAKLLDPTLQFAKFSDRQQNMQKYGIRKLSSIRKIYRSTKLTDYTKVLAVMHPLDKVFLNYQESRNFPKRSRFRRSSINLNDSREFGSFLDMLVESDLLIEGGWVPVNDACRPCVLSYDFIVKSHMLQQDLERLQQNITYLPLTKKTLTDGKVFREASEIYGNKSTKYYDKYKDVTNKTLDKLLDAYKLDFQLLNYDELMHGKLRSTEKVNL